MDIKYKLDSIFLLRSSRLVPLTMLQYSVNIHSVWDLWYSCFWHCQIGFTSPYCFLSSSNCSGPLVISLSFSSEKFFSFGSNWGLLGKVMGEVRPSMSVTVVRAQAVCLLERLGQLLPGARAAAQRRQVALQLDERRRRERQAFALAHERRGLGRVGRAFVP